MINDTLPMPQVVAPDLPVAVEIYPPESPFGGVLIQLPAGIQSIGIGSGPPGPPGPVGPPGEQGAGINNDLSGFTMIPIGQTYVDVVFAPQSDVDWIFLEARVVNTVDPTPLNIWDTIVTSKANNGFRMQLSGPPDTGNYRLSWTIRGIPAGPVIPATTYFLSGPASGPEGVPSSFSVALPGGSSVSSPVTITPSDGGAGGTFSPSSVVLATAVPAASFTYTPSSYGPRTISTTNSGSLVNPASISFVSVAASYTLSGPSSGNVGTPSTNFTVALPTGAPVAGTLTVTPNDGGAGGTFTPTSVALTTGTPSATFTYTPSSTGTKTISVTNNGGLTDPGALSYNAVSPLHLLNNLISYWKLDEATGVRFDSVVASANHFADPSGSTEGIPGKLNNGVIFGGATHLEIPNNSSLQVTGDFTWSLWLKVSDPSTFQVIISKAIIGGNIDYLLFNAAPLTLAVGHAGVGGGGVAGPPLVANTWIHVVAWWDSSDQKLRMRANDATTYVDTMARVPDATTQPLWLGGDPGGGGQYFMTGMVDEMGFWKRKLTSAEITALYGGGTPPPFSSFTT